MKIETTNLQTVKNYAANMGVTPSYIYKLIREGKMSSIIIDGVFFIEVKSYPNIPGR